MGKEYTRAEWLAEGERLFGTDYTKWRFRCPKCGNVATGQDFKDAGQNPNAMYCECIGRYVPGKGCDWAAYGLFDICKVHVDGQPVFEFAPETARAYHWMADYSVRLINGEQEDRKMGVRAEIEATNIQEALAIAQARAEAMPKEDPEIEAAFVWDIGIVETDYEF